MRCQPRLAPLLPLLATESGEMVISFVDPPLRAVFCRLITNTLNFVSVRTIKEGSSSKSNSHRTPPDRWTPGTGSLGSPRDDVKQGEASETRSHRIERRRG